MLDFDKPKPNKMKNLTTEEKNQIAADYVNGNLGDVRFAIFLNKQGKSAIPEIVAARTMDIYEFIRGWYGMSQALSFSAWIRKI